MWSVLPKESSKLNSKQMFLTINDIREISAKMTEKTGVEYSGYALSFFRRRLALVLDKMGIHKVQDLYAALEDKDKSDAIVYHMTVPCTEMFRDPAFWRALRKNLSGRTSLTVWFPNLTNGYELYSLVILLKMIGVSDVRIVGNVQSARTLDEIKNISVAQKLDEVNKSNFERLESGCKYEDYFETTEEGHIRPKGDLLNGVKFVKGWFGSNPVEKYDLIIFRNILLEYGYKLHEKSVVRLCESLVEGGMLALGIKEPLIADVAGLKVIEREESIYGF